MNAAEVVSLAGDLVDALGPEPEDEDDIDERIQETEGRAATPDELSAAADDHQHSEWRRLVENAEQFLCDAVDWNLEPLRAAEALAPADRWDDETSSEFDKWCLILWSRMGCWRATAEPDEPDDDFMGRTLAGDLDRTLAGDLSRLFVDGFYRLGGPNPSGWRRCDQEAALGMFDRAHAEHPRDLITGLPVTPEELERARMALLLWEPTGRDERWRKAAR